jgi:light-regulated signal transduction histidine kinase (bacteriophytochrome)
LNAFSLSSLFVSENLFLMSKNPFKQPKQDYNPQGYALYISPKTSLPDSMNLPGDAVVFYMNPLAFTGFVAVKWNKMVGVGILKAKGIWRRLHSLRHLIDIKVHERTAELELANKQLESFGYSVSHDLKAPLRIISGFCDILLESPALPEQERLEILKLIRNSAKKMGILIDTLMDFSKTNVAHVSKQRSNMNAMISTIIKQRHASSKAEFIQHYIPDAYCDAKLIEQVWVNLISNAVKYSGKVDQAIVEVGATLLRGIPVYYVRDNGAGFDMKFAAKLFRPFQRLHNESDFEGSGIGLALCYSIILKHGGRMWAKAAVDQGSTFYFTLH